MIVLSSVISLQLKATNSEQEQSLKDQLHRVQEQAQQQMQEVTAQLQTKTATLGEKERESSELRIKLEGDIGSLQALLQTRSEELQSAEKTVHEVCAVPSTFPNS